jgi:hypothetical protein
MSHVAVWLTNYANDDYLEVAIASVLNQSHTDLNLYICDNHSPGSRVADIIWDAVQDKRARAVTTPKGLAGIPMMKFCWEFLNGTVQDYSITIGGHDAWESPEFLSTLVERISTDTYKTPAIVYPDVWQIDEKGEIFSRYVDILQTANLNPLLLPQFVISGVNSPQLFGLWNEEVRRRVPVRYACSGWDHLVVAEASIHGTILFEPRVRLLMRAPPGDDDLTKYGLRHLDPVLRAAGPKDYVQQLAWMLTLIDKVMEPVPPAAKAHYRMMLSTAMFCTYNVLRGHNLNICPGAGDGFYALQEVQQIFGAAKHIDGMYRKLVKDLA